MRFWRIIVLMSFLVACGPTQAEWPVPTEIERISISDGVELAVRADPQISVNWLGDLLFWVRPAPHLVVSLRGNPEIVTSGEIVIGQRDWDWARGGIEVPSPHEILRCQDDERTRLVMGLVERSAAPDAPAPVMRWMLLYTPRGHALKMGEVFDGECETHLADMPPLERWLESSLPGHAAEIAGWAGLEEPTEALDVP